MENKKRLVDAMKIVTHLSKRINTLILLGATPKEVYDQVLQVIAEAPTEDAVEVVHGRWKPYHEADIGYDEYGVRCSKCGFEVEDHEVKFIMHYCPNCGAKNDGGSANG